MELPPPRPRPVSKPLLARPKPRAPSSRASAAAAAAAGVAPSHELEHQIRLRVAREKLAYETCLALVEKAVPPATLRSAAPLIGPPDYEGVLEERTNERLCAYPCCDAALPPFRPRQQLAIQRAEGKVVHTQSTHRFCSAACKRASSEFARALSADPAMMPGAEPASTGLVELPPDWAIVGLVIALVLGVGALQFSLGDVLNEVRPRDGRG
jgi:hypothetical protein